ncbi:MarR family winged helix-turn-helix transcriptional regulator [Streptomyces erythrogriseus]
MRARKEDSIELWSQLSVLVAEVGTALDRRLSEDYELGLTDFLALRALANGDPSGTRMNELAQLLGLNQSSATRAVQRLESRSLAERGPTRPTAGAWWCASPTPAATWPRR